MALVGFNRDMEERELGGDRIESLEARLVQAQDSDDETRLQALEDLYAELEKGLEDPTSGI